MKLKTILFLMVRKLGSITVKMPDKTGDKNRQVKTKVCFGGTFFVTCKDVTTGVVYSAKYDFLMI